MVECVLGLQTKNVGTSDIIVILKTNFGSTINRFPVDYLFKCLNGITTLTNGFFSFLIFS